MARWAKNLSRAFARGAAIFANLSGHPEQDYFSDGMTEALNELGKISALRVISPPRTFRHSPQSGIGDSIRCARIRVSRLSCAA
jgi:hypothetical protein